MSPAGPRRLGAALGRALVDLLFPEGGCVICGGLLPDCLRWAPEACPVCLEGIFAHGGTGPRGRGPDNRGVVPDAVPLRAVVTGGPYRGPLEQAVLRLKKVPDRRLARFLAHLLAERLSLSGAPSVWDGVVPVPLHPVRERERGFNQADLLARELAARVDAPLRADLCRRVRETFLQTGLSRRDRSENVFGVFHVEPGRLAGGVRFLIVDDVLTTGATARDVARALTAAGAVEVWCAAVAWAQ